MGIQIQRALRRDHSELLNIFTQNISSENSYPIIAMQKFTELLNSRSFKTLVVRDNKKIIGFAVYTVKSMVKYPVPIVEIVEFLIRDDYKNLGIEEKVMNLVFNFTSEKDSFYTINTYQVDNKENIEMMKFNNFAYHYAMDI